MNKPKIDLLKQKHRLRTEHRSPALFFGRIIAVIAVIAAMTGIVFSYQVSSTDEGSGSFPEISFFSTLKHLVSSDDRELEGEEEDRVNFLLMGVGGEGHSGPQLTDTIIFTSYEPSSSEIAMMSLPRDMSVPIPGYGYRKVNHANAYGEMDEPGAGPALATQVIGDVLDQEIHYYLRVDFDGFAEFIDAIGGIDVYVDQTFTDPVYPSHGMEYADCRTVTSADDLATEEDDLTDELAAILTPDENEYAFVKEDEDEADLENTVEVEEADYSCRYESLTFYEGWTHMDGETALKFARSRHGNNGEGSDFARSRRQQKIILAVKDEVLSASTFLNPSRIGKMLDTLKDNIATNMSVAEIVRLATEFKDLDTSNIVHHVVDSSPDSPLYATVLNGAYVLLPKNDDWSPLRRIAENIFTTDEELHTQIAEADEEKPKFVRVEVQNGTSVTGLAFSTSQLLDKEGYDVVKIGNAQSREYEHTVIYDLTNGQEADALRELRDYLGADVSLSATGWMIGGTIVPKELTFSTDDYEELTTEDNVDFLVILGENASSLAVN
ncbi:MAG: LCP family protein [bacterium]|jgi:polyisoprenyl-teichoic acid--peptidoglycan teichoic acid transferase|nr:LCP family protein [bacterium]